MPPVSARFGGSPGGAQTVGGGLVSEDGRVTLASRNLKEFPAGILDPAAGMEQWWLAPEVRTIDLCFNAIRAVPPHFHQLTDTLVSLKMAGNQLTQLPESIGQLVQLKCLDVQKNHLTSLPDLSGLRECLVDLQVAENQLAHLHPSICTLTRLERCNVASNRLTALPEQFGQLRSLVDLNISDNGLCALPVSLSRGCTRLAKLVAARNSLQSVDLSSLSALQHLDMRQNQLLSVTLASPVLTEVFFGLNLNLRQLPPTLRLCCAPSQLQPQGGTLVVLDASDCGLTDVPDYIRHAHGLHTVDLRNNELQTLPAWLGFLPKLERLAVEGNPLRSMKRSLVTASAASGGTTREGGHTAALKAYLRTRASDEENVLFTTEMTTGVSTSAGLATHIEHGRSHLSSTCAAAAAAMASESESSLLRCVVSSLRACVEDTHGRLALDRARTAPAALHTLPLSLLQQSERGMEGALARVRHLSLDGQELGCGGEDSTTGPALCAVLRGLQGISLVGNKLTVVPSFVTAHSWYNPARAVPWTSACTLQHLALARNSLTDSALAALHFPPTLLSLDLSHNNLTSMAQLGACVANLTVLQHLNVRHNGLSCSAHVEMDDDALWLPSLLSLDLAQNRLTSIPCAVFALQRLQSLDVSENELALIPPHLGLLAPNGSLPAQAQSYGSLNSLNIAGNPQRGVRFSLLERGVLAVLDFLRCRVPPGTEFSFLQAYSDKPVGGVHARAVPAHCRLEIPGTNTGSRGYAAPLARVNGTLAAPRDLSSPYTQGPVSLQSSYPPGGHGQTQGLHTNPACTRAPYGQSASTAGKPLGQVNPAVLNGLPTSHAPCLPPASARAMVHPPTGHAQQTTSQGMGAGYTRRTSDTAPAPSVNSGAAAFNSSEEPVDLHDVQSIRQRIGHLHSLLATGGGSSTGPRALLAKRELNQLLAAESRLSAGR